MAMVSADRSPGPPGPLRSPRPPRSPRSPRSPGSRPPRSLSQEIHDELMATELAEDQAADLELMTLGEVMGTEEVTRPRKNYVFIGKFTINGDCP